MERSKENCFVPLCLRVGGLHNVVVKYWGRLSISCCFLNKAAVHKRKCCCRMSTACALSVCTQLQATLDGGDGRHQRLDKFGDELAWQFIVRCLGNVPVSLDEVNRCSNLDTGIGMEWSEAM